MGIIVEITDTDTGRTDTLERIKRRRSRPEQWTITRRHNGAILSRATYTGLGAGIRAWWEEGHETPHLTSLPRITRHRTAADLTWLLEDLEIEHVVTPEGGVRCQLSEGHSLLLYQHCAADGADIEGLWAWCETTDDDVESGGLDTYVQLRELIAEMAGYRCLSDRYESGKCPPYATVAEFREMCRECFGEAPELTERADGCYYDETGERVLEPVA